MKPSKSSSSRLAWAFQLCHDKGVRKTRARDAVLERLMEGGPQTWKSLSDSEPLRTLCNPSTVFRLLVRLEEIGLIRRITVRERPPFFALEVPGDHHHDYVICTGCASIESLHILCPGSRLEKQLEEELGFRNLQHEFSFYGLCKACAASALEA